MMYVKQFMPNYSTLKHIPQKNSETLNEDLEQLKLRMNSDTCFSYFGESIY